MFYLTEPLVRDVNDKRYYIVQIACMMLPYMGISKPDRLYNEILVRAHPSDKVQERPRSQSLACDTSVRLLLALPFWMDQSSPVVTTQA